MNREVRHITSVVVTLALCAVMVGVPIRATATTGAGKPGSPLGRVRPLGLVTPTGVDDDVPGVPLDSYPIISRTVTGTLDAYPISLPPVDKCDVYSVYLAPGEQITLDLTGPAGNFDLLLLAPGTVSVNAPRYVQIGEAPGSTEHICYTAADLFGAGTYYVVVTTDDAEGEYALTWRLSGRSDGNVPGTRLETQLVTGTVDPVDDPDDVYRIPLEVGQTLTVTVTVDPWGESIGLGVLPPRWDNAGIWEPTTDIWFCGDATFGQGSRVTHYVYVDEGEDIAGDYYLDVYAPDVAVGYTLEWEVLPGLAPGAPLPPSPVVSELATTTVYETRLRAGDTFTGSIDASPGAEIGGRLYAPDGSVVWENTGLADPKPFSYVTPAAEEGYYHLELTPWVAGGCRLDWSIDRASARVQGSDRYATAVQASRSAFPDGADVVVLASGADFPDALSAAGLAGAYDAPLLLVQPNALPASVWGEISRLGATRCFIVGGEAAVSAGVANAVIEGAGITPVRVAGADRYATAAEVARRVVDRLGPDYDGGVFVARGDLFPDALAAAPLAWRARRPVLLTRPTALPSVTSSALAEIEATGAVVLGSETAVSEPVRLQVAALVGAAQRVSGGDRYATAVEVAKWGVSSGFGSYRYVGIATGSNFPDALGGGIATGAEGGVLLLTRPDVLSTPTAGLMTANKPSLRWVRVFGSTKAVSTAVSSGLDALLR
ncbi:MAG: hypothetical protein CVT59_09825 [Actinobacteria bacterium HGW-Actinobacteria-1]|jgi:putative cell wall-binding protein|nr:MAG: hypothetical protein CVT59_09825 [Actinobacteria bacterium HGW-Actinobacteria-1]